MLEVVSCTPSSSPSGELGLSFIIYLLSHQFRMLSLYVRFRLITCSISTFWQQAPWNKILDCSCKVFCLVRVEVLKIDGRREELSCCCFDKPFTCITHTLLKEITPKKGYTVHVLSVQPWMMCFQLRLTCFSHFPSRCQWYEAVVMKTYPHENTRCILFLVRDAYFCECISLGWYNINHQFDFVWSLIVV